MWFALISLAWATPVQLHVGLDRSAGSLAELAVDGAAGLCHLAAGERVICEADGPVLVRWAGDAGFELVGGPRVAPGETVSLWVMAKAGAGPSAAEILAAPDGPALEALVLRSGERVPGPWSRAAVDAVLKRTSDSDPRVRKVAVQGLLPWLRAASFDPMAPEAPSVLPDGLLLTLARDKDVRVRRTLASALREVRADHVLAPQAYAALRLLLADGSVRVERVSLAASAASARGEGLPAMEAWRVALKRVREPGALGRTACNTLARMHSQLGDSTEIDPVEAVRLVVEHHPERGWRVWRVWRERVPFSRAMGERLLSGSVGYSPGLVASWAETDPNGLAALLAWSEPGPVVSERGQWIRRALDEAEADRLSGVGDPL